MPTPDKDQPNAQTDDLVSMPKAEFTKFVSEKIREQDARRLRQIQELEEKAKDAEALRQKVSELEEAVSGRKRTDEERWAAEVAKREAQAAALAKKLEEAQRSSDAVRERWQAEYRSQYLMRLAADAGAASSALSDVPALFPSAGVAVKETPEGLQAELVDPTTGLPHHSPVDAMRAWLANKPHLRAAPPSGAGQHGAAPSEPTKKDPLDGLNPMQQIAFALKSGKRR